ncbi:MAG: hypothetical protein Q7T24_00275 [Deltaproteobacteria bacterium]|nr:hypothetical protein [Deltaproteobacteria bacterium]
MKRFGILAVAVVFAFTGLISSCKKKEEQPAPGGAEMGTIEASPAPGGAEGTKAPAGPAGGAQTTAAPSGGGAK